MTQALAFIEADIRCLEEIPNFNHKYFKKLLALEAEYVFRNLIYILGTNSVLIRLVLEDRISKEDLKFILENTNTFALYEASRSIDMNLGPYLSIFKEFGHKLYN